MSWGSHPAETKYVRYTSGPLGSSRSCNLCKFHVFTPKGKGYGRGYGMREGNKARGQIIQHLKTEHPAEYAAAMKAGIDIVLKES